MRLLAVALTAVLIVASVAAIVGGFALLARRLLGMRFGLVRLVLAGLVGFAVVGPIAEALAGSIRGGGTATPLWFLLLAGAAALVVVGQALSRELSLASTGQETVRALGASRGHLLAAMMVPIGLVGAAGALVGAGLAVLASPLTPMGLALRAEPAPGFLVHLAGLGVGMVATLLLVVGRVAG